MLELGRAARQHWTLLDGAIFLNHGSFGACPRIVQDERAHLLRALEEHPDGFIPEFVMPIRPDSPLRAVAERLGDFIGTSGENVALVENATSGINAVLQSLAFGPGDEILITNHQYGAVRLAVEARCAATGATPVTAVIPLPASSGGVVDGIIAAASDRVKLAVIDHITSPTALVFPIFEVVGRLQARGIPVLVDAAHSIGQIPLEVDRLGADWLVANMHKWLYAPKGSALLATKPSRTQVTRPLVTSHFVNLGFPRSFDYTGTRDYTGWLAVPTAMAFFDDVGRDKLWRHTGDLIDLASRRFEELGASHVGPRAMAASMRSFILPQRRKLAADDAGKLTKSLWDRKRVEVFCAGFDGNLVLRVSAQAYVDESDIEQLVSALRTEGWPGR